MNENHNTSKKDQDLCLNGEPCQRDIAQGIIESIPLGIVAFDSDLKITECNKQACNMLSSYNTTDTIAEIVRTSFRKHHTTNWEDQISQAIQKESPTAFDDITFSRNGLSKTIRIICSSREKADNAQTNIGGTLIIEDVTAEVMMHNDLAAAERLAAVGRLSAKVAHELNNPLDGILRYINLAARVIEGSGESPATSYLNESRKGLLRMVKIISELLEFSRSSYSAFKEADINKIVEDAVKAMENMAIENMVEITREYQKNLPNIRSGNLFQVFTNLIKNSIDSMEDAGGKLEISTYMTESELVIDFSDTGTGLPQEVQEKLFEPFFSTKQAGKGTGLGLAICKDIIEKYNGQIVPENHPETGCTFSVRIPIDRTSLGNEI